MIILACDTSTDYATFALGTESGELLASEVFKHDRNLSQRFYVSLDTLLSNAGIKFDDVDVLAVGIGPGSFTGVRVAVTTFKTLAQVTKKPLLAVGTLEIYAKSAETADCATVVAILPSRKGEVYYQIFQPGISHQQATVITLDNLLLLIKESPDEILIAGQTSSLPAEFDDYRRLGQLEPPAKSLIQLAAEELNSNKTVNPLVLTPFYAALPSISIHKSR